MSGYTKVGLEALLTQQNCVLLLIDHQPFQLANVNSHEPTMVINNTAALAKVAKASGVVIRNDSVVQNIRMSKSLPSIETLGLTR